MQRVAYQYSGSQNNNLLCFSKPMGHNQYVCISTFRAKPIAHIFSKHNVRRRYSRIPTSNPTVAKSSISASASCLRRSGLIFINKLSSPRPATIYSI